jgi:ABC-type branched-subunit amino acid transport system substrate-binding protein
LAEAFLNATHLAHQLSATCERRDCGACARLGSLLGSGGCKDPERNTSNGGTGTATTANSPGQGGGAAQDMSGDTILIGHYASMTGETSSFGKQTDAGIRFAMDELNANGGVLDKKIVVETQDDQSKAEEAKTVVTRFANDPKMVAVLGEVASSRSKFAAPVLQEAKIPMISPSSTNPDVTKVGDYIFASASLTRFRAT